MKYYCCQVGRSHYGITVLNEKNEPVYSSATVWREGVWASELECKLVERARSKGFNVTLK